MEWYLLLAQECLARIRNIVMRSIEHQSSEGKLDRLALGSELYVLYIVKPQCCWVDITPPEPRHEWASTSGRLPSHSHSVALKVCATAER
jgi:hypothetical protein